MNTIEIIEQTDWRQYKGPENSQTYNPEYAMNSLLRLYKLTEENDNWNTCISVEYSIGNGHRGTYYSAIKSVLPIIIEIAQYGQSEVSRNCALGILVDFHGFQAEIATDDIIDREELEQWVTDTIEEFMHKDVARTESDRNKNLVAEFIENEIYRQELRTLISSLPTGWSYLYDDKVVSLHELELKKELSKRHILYKKDFQIFAQNEGSGDILCRNREDRTHFAVVHLTWSGKKEKRNELPYVKYYGSFDGFLEYENGLLMK